MSEETRRAAEQAYQHFLDDPLYFTELWSNPQAWDSCEECTSLDVFAINSELGTRAGKLIEELVVEVGGSEASAALAGEIYDNLTSAGNAQSKSPNVLVVAGVAATGIAMMTDAAEADYPLKAGKWEWHHYTPIYLGGDPKGPQYRLPAGYHQYITNEFRQQWGYRNQAGIPDPVRLRSILREVYKKYPIPPGSERR